MSADYCGLPYAMLFWMIQKEGNTDACLVIVVLVSYIEYSISISISISVSVSVSVSLANKLHFDRWIMHAP